MALIDQRNETVCSYHLFWGVNIISGLVGVGIFRVHT